MPVKKPAIQIMLAGDTITLLLVTLAGFARHNELETAGSRMLTTFVPLVVAWLLLAPHLQAFDLERASELRQLWRPFWAMVLAAPMAGLLRGVWLNAGIIPTFVVVLGGVSALALLAWRFLFWAFIAWRSLSNG
jgi:hypothetical protein